MKLRIVFSALLACMLILACKNTGTRPEGGLPGELGRLEKEVMDIHDEVMPRMTDINNLLGQIRAIREGVLPDEEGRKTMPDGIDHITQKLKMAEHGMWDWMKAYSDTRETLGEKELTSFFRKEKESVTKVRTEMLSAIDEAEKWLEIHKPSTN